MIGTGKSKKEKSGDDGQRPTLEAAGTMDEFRRSVEAATSMREAMAWHRQCNEGLEAGRQSQAVSPSVPGVVSRGRRTLGTFLGLRRGTS
ncbi:MAG: hypothetical protein KDJ41_10105 [Hyphomicrobiaceae bacterium]|nr:hypothetical protein [Hyphomicrobiaceae bacterium]